jgi:hypothetical protein
VSKTGGVAGFALPPAVGGHADVAKSRCRRPVYRAVIRLH